MNSSGMLFIEFFSINLLFNFYKDDVVPAEAKSSESNVGKVSMSY